MIYILRLTNCRVELLQLKVVPISSGKLEDMGNHMNLDASTPPSSVV